MEKKPVVPNVQLVEDLVQATIEKASIREKCGTLATKPPAPEKLQGELVDSLKEDQNKANHLRISRILGPHVYGSEDRLKYLVAEIKCRVIICKKEIYEIGCMLPEAKQIVGHGNFKKWIKDTFDFGYETAVNFMNVYKACLGNPEIVTSMKASVLYQISSPSFPADLRQHIFECNIGLADIKNEDVREMLRKYKAGELNLDSDEVEQFFADNERWVQLSHVHSQLSLAVNALQKYKDNIARVGRRPWQTYEREGLDGQDPEAGERIKIIIGAMYDCINILNVLREDLCHDLNEN